MRIGRSCREHGRKDQVSTVTWAYQPADASEMGAWGMFPLYLSTLCRDERTRAIWEMGTTLVGRDRLPRGGGGTIIGVGVTHRHYCEGGAVSVVRLGGRLEGGRELLQ